MKTFFTILLLTLSSFSLTQTYTADQSKKDFYVNNLLANDGLSQLNFMLCYLKNTNSKDFVDKGTYIALIDEEKCESSTGADSSSEAASATATSAQSSKTSSTATAVDSVEYTTGTFKPITDDYGAVKADGWIELEMPLRGDPTETNREMIAYNRLNVQADVSETNPFGIFDMVFDVRNTSAIGAPFNYPANTVMLQGAVSVKANEIVYVETGAGPELGIKVDKSTANITQGAVKNAATLIISGSAKMYSVVHQFYVNDSSNVYCQKFSKANEITFGASGVSLGADINDTDFASLVSSASTGYIPGGISNATGEHCWGTSKADTKRTVYKYGTYNAGNLVASDENKKYDASVSSFSLEGRPEDNSNAFSEIIRAYASYWGSDLPTEFRSTVTDSTIFKNANNPDDTNSYNLKKEFLQVQQIVTSKNQLSDLDKIEFFAYVGNLKSESDWSTKISNLGFPSSGSCDAADGNCQEYGGEISVSGSTITFKITKGIDWSSGNGPFDLDTPFEFTAANWVTQMTNGSGWTRGWHVWDDTNRRGYEIPYTAMQNPTTTVDANKVRSRTESKIAVSDLPSSLLCITNCLDASEMNKVMAGILGVIDADGSGQTLNISPYKNVGPWFKEEVYYDSNNNGANNGGGEFTMAKGSWTWVGGIKSSDAVTYSVSSGQLLDSSTALTWKADAETSYTVPSSGSLNVADKITALTRENQEKIRDFRYYEKPYSLGTTYNYARNAGHWFDMELIANTSTNKTAIECEKTGGVYNGLDTKIKKSSDNSVYFDDSATYYCPDKLYRGAIETTYRVGVVQRAEYDLFNGSTKVAISPPETLTFTVPAASSMRYNESGLDYVGKKFQLKFNGYGELHNIPGKVINACTGAVVGKYVNSWDECYRYVHDFVIPDGTILVNSDVTKPNVKVLGMRGDDFITKKSASDTSALNVSYTVSDVPAASTLTKQHGDSSSSDYIGAKPTHSTSSPFLNSGKPSVIHGETVFTPSN